MHLTAHALLMGLGGGTQKAPARRDKPANPAVMDDSDFAQLTALLGQPQVFQMPCRMIDAAPPEGSD